MEYLVYVEGNHDDRRVHIFEPLTSRGLGLFAACGDWKWVVELNQKMGIDYSQRELPQAEFDSLYNICKEGPFARRLMHDRGEFDPNKYPSLNELLQ